VRIKNRTHQNGEHRKISSGAGGADRGAQAGFVPTHNDIKITPLFQSSNRDVVKDIIYDVT